MHASIVITSNTLHNTIGDHFLVDVVLPFVRRGPGGPPPPAAFDSKSKGRSVLSIQSPNKVSHHQLVPDKLAREKKITPLESIKLAARRLDDISCRSQQIRVPIALLAAASSSSLLAAASFSPLLLPYWRASAKEMARHAPRRRLADDGSVPTSPRRRRPAGRAAKSWQKKKTCASVTGKKTPADRSRLIARTFQLLAAAQTRACPSVNYYYIARFQLMGDK
jgi:hypothetical protein